MRGSTINSAYVEITNQCNYACAYCYNNSRADKDQFVDRDQYIRWITLLRAHGLKNVALSGGEPFLHSDIFDLLDYNDHIGVTNTVITNSSLLTDEIIRRVADTNTSLNLTLDRYDAVSNDQMRGTGTYDKLLQTIDCLSRRGLMHRVNLRCNLSFDSIIHIEQATRLASLWREYSLPEATGSSVGISGLQIGAPLSAMRYATI